MTNEPPDEVLSHSALDQELEKLVAADPSPEFLARVRTRIARESAPGDRRFAWLVTAAGTLAVAMVLLISVSRMGQSPPEMPEPPSTTGSRRSSDIVLSPTLTPPMDVTASTEPPPVSTQPSSAGEGVALPRATERAHPLVLVSREEAAALKRLFADAREGRVLLPRESDQAMVLGGPPEEIVIAPIAVEPLSL